MGKILTIALALCVLPACTTAVPVVKEAQKCQPSAAMLQACDEPAAVRAGVTYQDLLKASLGDRENLKACALRQKMLADTISSCNASIDKYNAEIREINARNAKQ